ncbi:MAG: domain containing protein [Myxococcales bacterium]|nr:domain containing protein [Myxococcales bacterium]
MAGAKVPLTFRIFKGDQLLREERLSLSVIKLGKVPSAHLKLDDETVSRMHAIIEVNGPGDVSIIDLGSTKGTFVNGQKVNKAKLQSGDTIVVGDTRIELSIGAGEEEAPARPQPQTPDSGGQQIMSSAPRPNMPANPMAQTMPSQPPRAPAPPQSFTPPQQFAPPPAAFTPPQQFAPAPQQMQMRPPPGMAGGAPIYGTAMAAPAGFQTAMAESVDDFHGHAAVEVAAMLGDSVVGVKHCIDPKGGSISSGTWLLTAIGALLLCASIGAFVTSVQNAAFNKGALDAWTRGDRARGIEPRPSYAYRPKTLSMGFDWIALGGLAGSLVMLTSAVARARKESESPYVRIGIGEQRTRNWVILVWIMFPITLFFLRRKKWSDLEFPTEGAPAQTFPMVAPHGNDFAFHFGHGMDGEMIVGNQSTSLAELAQQGRTTISPIPMGAKIRVRAGRTTFLVSAVPAPRRHVMPLFANVEGRVLAYFGGSLAAHMILWLLLQQVQVEDSGTNIDLASLEDTSLRSNNSSQDDPPPPEQEDKPDDGKDESGGTGTAMALDEGKMGKKDSDRAEGQYKMQKTQADPQLARQQAVEAARNAGILGNVALTQGGAFASLTGTGDVSSGFDDNNIYGGLLGNEAGEMNGGFGFGRSGFGPGGGGTGWGTIGTGRYGTIGHGSGTGSGYGVGGGRGGMRGRTSAVPTVSIGQPNAQGDLDKAIIRRYIKRNIQKITYCYEKQLLAKPGLAGTVVTQFFITPNGNVASSSGSGVDPEVASCVADVIHGIEFPKPKGGGGVQVNYPFTFRPAGQ